MDTYILEIDPDPQLVPTARMFAATVARQLGCPEDAVLDVKIAISEACTNAVQAQRRPRRRDACAAEGLRRGLRAASTRSRTPARGSTRSRLSRPRSSSARSKATTSKAWAWH